MMILLLPSRLLNFNRIFRFSSSLSFPSLVLALLTQQHVLGNKDIITVTKYFEKDKFQSKKTHIPQITCVQGKQ